MKYLIAVLGALALAVASICFWLSHDPIPEIVNLPIRRIDNNTFRLENNAPHDVWLRALEGTQVEYSIIYTPHWAEPPPSPQLRWPVVMLVVPQGQYVDFQAAAPTAHGLTHWTLSVDLSCRQMTWDPKRWWWPLRFAWNPVGSACSDIMNIQ